MEAVIIIGFSIMIASIFGSVYCAINGIDIVECIIEKIKRIFK